MNPASLQERLGWRRTKGPRLSPVNTVDLTDALGRVLFAEHHDRCAVSASPNSSNSNISVTLELEEELREYRSALGPSSSLSALAASLAKGPIVFSSPPKVPGTDTTTTETETSAVFGAGGGLSGATWYYSADHMYVFKSLQPEEVDTLRSLLPELTRHVATAKADLGFGGASGVASSVTFLPAYTVVVRVRTGILPCSDQASNQGFFGGQQYTHGDTIVLVAMPNIFWRDVHEFSGTHGGILEAYDIKGSGSRFRTPAEEGLGPLKDLNWCPRCREDASGANARSGRPHRVLSIGKHRQHELLSTLARDCAWLETHGRMDYSLLVAVAPHCSDEKRLTSSTNSDWWASSEIGFFSSSQALHGASSLDGSHQAVGSANKQSWYRLGLVDILASYGIRKRLEAEIRVRFLAEDRSRISSVRPSVYSARLQTFVEMHSE